MNIECNLILLMSLGSPIQKYIHTVRLNGKRQAARRHSHHQAVITVAAPSLLVVVQCTPFYVQHYYY